MTAVLRSLLHWCRQMTFRACVFTFLTALAAVVCFGSSSRGEEVDSSRKPKHQSIVAAIAKGDQEDVALWIANGENVNSQNDAGWTPLHYAAVRNQAGCAELLLKNGALVDVRTKSGQTALHLCAQRNFMEVAGVLLENGASLAAQEKDGWTPLHYAATHNHIDMVKLLIKKGADVNAVSTGGGTPLHEAAAGAGWQMIDLLIQKGADKSIKAKNGKTPLDYAVELKNDAARDILQADLWFPVGEQLVHRVCWGFIPVGKSVTSSRWIEEDGRRLIAVRIRTRTNSVFDKIRPVDDVVESIIDPKTFRPVSFQRRMIRRNEQCHEFTAFDFQNLTATWTTRCTDKTNTFEIASDTRDILTFTYLTRKEGFPVNSEKSYRIMADEGMFDLGIKTGETEDVKLPVFGNVESLCVYPTFDFDGLLVDKGRFRLWISLDERHLMVRTKIDGKLADVRVTLCKVLGPGSDLWIQKMKESNESLETIEPEQIENMLLE